MKLFQKILCYSNLLFSHYDVSLVETYFFKVIFIFALDLLFVHTRTLYIITTLLSNITIVPKTAFLAICSNWFLIPKLTNFWLLFSRYSNWKRTLQAVHWTQKINIRSIIISQRYENYIRYSFSTSYVTCINEKGAIK